MKLQVACVFLLVISACKSMENEDIDGDMSEKGQTKSGLNGHPGKSAQGSSSRHSSTPLPPKRPLRIKQVFQPVSLPTDFQSYDVLEKDGFITLEELINVTEARVNVELAFSASDIDGDGRLTEEEFNNAPWSLQGDSQVGSDDVTQLDKEYKSQPPTPPALQDQLDNSEHHQHQHGHRQQQKQPT